MKAKTGILIALCSVFIALGIFLICLQLFTPGAAWFFTPYSKPQSHLLTQVEESAHIQDVPKGEIRYLINEEVYFPSARKKGNFMFENPESCEYDLQFFVYLMTGDGETETLVYRSPVLKPGTSVYEDKLRTKLSPGKHDCLYYARAYSKSGELSGDRSGTMTITVGG